MHGTRCTAHSQSDFVFILFSDLQQATAVLEKLLEQKERLGEEATLMCELEIASLKLKKGEQLLVRTALEDAKSKLDKMEGVEPVVNASYYRVASEYHKVCATWFNVLSSHVRHGYTCVV